MFFRKDYAAPGPGIDPNAPEKTGFARFLEILQIECATLVKLNLLFLATCLPVATIPPAIFAMHMVVRKMVLDQPVDCFHDYCTAFKKYWKLAYGAFFVFFVTMLASAYLYGLLSLGKPLKEAVRRSLLFGVGKPLRAALAALSVYGSLLVAVLEFPLSAIYLLFLGFSVPCLLGNFFMRTVLKQYFEV